MAFDVAAETSSHVPANSSATRSGRAWVKENGGGKGGRRRWGERWEDALTPTASVLVTRPLPVLFNPFQPRRCRRGTATPVGMKDRDPPRIVFGEDNIQFFVFFLKLF